jgi:hypothetical protein
MEKLANKIKCLLLGHSWEKWWTSLYFDYKAAQRNCKRCSVAQHKNTVSSDQQGDI